MPPAQSGASQEAEPVHPRSQAAWPANHRVKMIWPVTAADEKGSEHTLQAALRLRRFPTYRTREDHGSKRDLGSVNDSCPYRRLSGPPQKPKCLGLAAISCWNFRLSESVELRFR
jgi:hypothetical protein